MNTQYTHTLRKKQILAINTNLLLTDAIKWSIYICIFQKHFEKSRYKLDFCRIRLTLQKYDFHFKMNPLFSFNYSVGLFVSFCVFLPKTKKINCLFFKVEKYQEFIPYCKKSVVTLRFVVRKKASFVNILLCPCCLWHFALTPKPRCYFYLFIGNFLVWDLMTKLWKFGKILKKISGPPGVP